MALAVRGRHGRLPAFLRYLSTVPEPVSLVQALQDGPLRPFGARGSLLFARTSEDALLCMAAATDVIDVVRDRYSLVPLSLDIPIANTCRAGTIDTFTLPTLADAFPALAVDRHVWDSLSSVGETVYCAAIKSSGESVGLLSFIVDAERAHETVDLETIEALRYALGMWLSRPDVAQRVADERHIGSAPFVLSLRQRDIVNLIDAGLTNAEIGDRLGYSTSLVKQEVQRMMRGLRVDGRLELVERIRALDML